MAGPGRWPVAERNLKSSSVVRGIDELVGTGGAGHGWNRIFRQKIC